MLESASGGGGLVPGEGVSGPGGGESGPGGVCPGGGVGYLFLGVSARGGGGVCPGGWGVCSWVGCIPACTEADTHPPWT